MKKDLNYLFTVLARGGSKRIPKKNIRDFLGKPIISYPLNLMDKFKSQIPLHISSEDDEIISLLKSIGYEIDFKRPSSLAKDSTPTLDVIKFIVDQYKKVGKEFSHIINIPPTSVFCTSKIIKEAIQLSKENPHKIIITVKEFNVPIENSYSYENTTKKLKPLITNCFLKNTQDFKKNVYDAGILAIIPIEILQFRNDSQIMADSFLGLKIKDPVVDIDEESDWLMAEKIYNLI